MTNRDELLQIRAELDRLRARVDHALLSMDGEREIVPIDAAEPIENLKLPRRALTCLHKAGIERVGQLAGKGYTELLRIPNLGKLTLKDIERALMARGLTLKDDWNQSR